ncbi:hypothetical protein Nepgr_000661 [Nepenthes gracilis]|uniref:Uncharacterized protein n=1 Tax=Nepenthes gracilis TaxID=150966 RepID=A0AAD3P745_NEPGR|nr:hypothetical protein Nepgr_000661 [Nepenthes gracilis]
MIEIAGEDVSLVQQVSVPVDHPSNFACSPLHIRISESSQNFDRSSQIAMVNDKMHIEEASCLSPHSKKENLKVSKNKLGTTNVSMETQKMKRSRKHEGYNLRKSLAWNKAFLTEEGVLNSLELSMISGILSMPKGEELSTIHEDGRESLSSNSGSMGVLTDQQSLEEKLFKQFPSRKLNEDKKIGCSLFHKEASLSGDHLISVSTPQRILSQHDLKKSLSNGGGCLSRLTPVSYPFTAYKIHKHHVSYSFC